MKAFLFSLGALLLLFALVICNSIYISNVTDKMMARAMEISSLDDTDAFYELCRLWEDNEILISVSVPHKESDELEKNIVILKSKLENRSQDELKESIALLQKSIDEITVHSTVSIDNVF